MPVWSPDGDRIVFSSNRKGVHDLYPKSVTGEGEELLLSTAQAKIATDWSRDGHFVLFNTATRRRPRHLGAPLDGKGKPFPVVQTGSTNRAGNSLLTDTGSRTSRTSPAAPNLRPTVSGPRKQVADFHQRRHSGALATRWEGIVLPRAEMAGSWRCPSESRRSHGPTSVRQSAVCPAARWRGAARRFPSPIHGLADGQRFLIATVKEPPCRPSR